MVQCVWFTSATHLATIPILRTQLYNMKHTGGQLHNAENAEGHLYSSNATVSQLSVYFRATLMALVLAMLVSSLIPTGHPLWLFGADIYPKEGVTFSALCFFDYNFPPETGPNVSRLTAFGAIWLAWSIGLATVTFVKRLFELVRPPKQGASNEGQPEQEEYTRERNVISVIIRFLRGSSLEALRTTWSLLGSFGGHVSTR